MIDTDIKRTITPLVERHLGAQVRADWTPVSGGSINQCYRIAAGEKAIFVKLNHAGAFPGMFDAEAKGLDLLRKHSSFQIPEVLARGEVNDTAYLVMAFISSGKRDPSFWGDFARNLATMHQHSADQFGLEHNNYIGSLEQPNDWRKTWPEFYIGLRLEPQLRRATDSGLADASLRRSFDRLFYRLESLFPEEPPALIHGDLWSGNFMCASSGKATIFDPAVYFGHREMDLAMSKLFGGFDRPFYVQYDEAYPLEQGWEERLPLSQLYPLLVHVNLFGRGYLAQLDACLRPFV